MKSDNQPPINPRSIEERLAERGIPQSLMSVAKSGDKKLAARDMLLHRGVTFDELDELCGSPRSITADAGSVSAGGELMRKAANAVMKLINESPVRYGREATAADVSLTIRQALSSAVPMRGYETLRMNVWARVYADCTSIADADKKTDEVMAYVESELSRLRERERVLVEALESAEILLRCGTKLYEQNRDGVLEVVQAALTERSKP